MLSQSLWKVGLVSSHLPCLAEEISKQRVEGEVLLLLAASGEMLEQGRSWGQSCGHPGRMCRGLV